MKNTVDITREQNHLLVSIVLKTSSFVKFILLFFVTVSIIFPLFLLFLNFQKEEPSLFLILAATGFAVFITRTLFRQLMWQTYGREDFVLSKNTIKYTPIIKYFKTTSQTESFDEFELLFSDRKLYKDNRVGTLIFLCGDTKIKSSLKMTEVDFEKVEAESKYKKSN
jgi:hypothetical protein